MFRPVITTPPDSNAQTGSGNPPQLAAHTPHRLDSPLPLFQAHGNIFGSQAANSMSGHDTDACSFSAIPEPIDACYLLVERDPQELEWQHNIISFMDRPGVHSEDVELLAGDPSLNVFSAACLLHRNDAEPVDGQLVRIEGSGMESQGMPSADVIGMYMLL